jgi:hypothetical protein
LIFCDPGASFIVENKVLTLAASAPYSDGVFMITARRSTMPQLWRVFATAIAPISSTSEKMSVSMMIGLGLCSVERQLVATKSKTRSVRRRNGIDSIAAPERDNQKSCLGVLCSHKIRIEHKMFSADVRSATSRHDLVAVEETIQNHAMRPGGHIVDQRLDYHEF